MDAELVRVKIRHSHTWEGLALELMNETESAGFAFTMAYAVHSKH